MPKTIRELADELKVSKQTIQYHYQRLPTKNRQKDSQGTNMISLTAERIIRDKVAKPSVANTQQTGSKKVTKTSKENNELIATLRREIEDLKSQRDKQLATKDQQISSKDRQIDHLIKLIDQQQQLQLTTVTENKQLKDHVQKLDDLLETFKSPQIRQGNDKKEDPNKNRIDKAWWHFW
ncbi:replication protein RepB [Lactiplantibacillus plantarum]|nr:replication protein RepB [Lactiplantibacillus plantarum]MCG0839312.1 replication protein RepB [Lactiplantibacillus plantarum]